MSNERASSVLVIGESIMDLIVKSGSTIESPGGSAANVALGLGRLGMSVDFLTSIAKDSFGLAISSYLEASGVNILAGSFNAPATSTAKATLNPSGHADYDFDIHWQMQVPSLSPKPRVLHVGSIAAFSRQGSQAVRDVMVRMSGHEVTFDPNIRPSLTRPHADEVVTFEATARLATIVKMSDDDAGWLYPKLTSSEAARRVRELGPKLVVVTAGAHGSLLAGKSFEVAVPPGIPTSVVDTIGAGDSYMAALIWWLLEHGPAELSENDAMHLGEFCGEAAAVTVARSGADLPSLADLKRP